MLYLVVYAEVQLKTLFCIFVNKMYILVPILLLSSTKVRNSLNFVFVIMKLFQISSMDSIKPNSRIFPTASHCSAVLNKRVTTFHMKF